MHRYTESQLRIFAADILSGMGASGRHAAIVADHLVDANLAGHDSHGIVRLPQYHQQVSEGKIDPRSEPQCSTANTPFALWDASWSWGQVAALAAVNRALEAAASSGFAVAGIHQCPHIGRLGAYTEHAAMRGYIALAWCNCGGAARVAPWGGTEARLATNPLSIAVPTASDPLLVDITTSVVAEGKVRIARNAGKILPIGWILNREGSPSTNPADLYEGGTILPLGGADFGYKGFALAMVCDLLAGVLTGAGCGLMPGVSFSNGVLIILLDPARFMPLAEFSDKVEAYLDYLRQTPTQSGIERILMPGDPERQTANKRRREGIPIDPGTWTQLVDLAKTLNVAVPASG